MFHVKHQRVTVTQEFVSTRNKWLIGIKFSEGHSPLTRAPADANERRGLTKSQEPLIGPYQRRQASVRLALVILAAVLAGFMLGRLTA